MIRKIDSISFGTKYYTKTNKNINVSSKCNIKRGLKAASIYALSTMAAYGILSACASNKKTPIKPPQPITEQIDTSVVVDTVQESKLAPNGYYTVKDGDNIWSISKALLEESNVENISDPLIYKKEQQIMQLNKLNYPSDTCDRVIIHAGDTLCVDPK